MKKLMTVTFTVILILCSGCSVQETKIVYSPQDVCFTADYSKEAYTVNTVINKGNGSIYNGELHIKTGEEDKTVYSSDKGTFWYPSWSPNGKKITFYAQSGEYKGICAYDEESGKVRVPQRSTSYVSSGAFPFAWSDDSSKALIFSDPICYYDWGKDEVVELKPSSGEEEIISATFLKGSKKVFYTALVGEDLLARVYDCATGERTTVANFPSGYNRAIDRVPCIALSETEALCYVYSEAGSTTFYRVDTSTGKTEKVLGLVTYAGYSPDGRYITYYSDSNDKVIYLYDMTVGQTVAAREYTPSGTNKNRVIPIWSLDSSRMMLWNSESFQEVDTRLNPVGEVVVCDDMGTRPVFTKDGVWYAKKEFIK